MTGRAGQGVYELGQWVETPLGRLGLLGLGGCGEVGGGSHWKCCVMMCSAKCSFPTVSCTRSRDHAACGSCSSAQCTTPWQGRVSSDKGRAWGAGGSGWWLEGAWWDAPDGDWWWWLEDAPEKWIWRISKSLVGSSLKIQTMNSRQFFCLSSWIQFRIKIRTSTREYLSLTLASLIPKSERHTPSTISTIYLLQYESRLCLTKRQCPWQIGRPLEAIFCCIFGSEYVPKRYFQIFVLVKNTPASNKAGMETPCLHLNVLHILFDTQDVENVEMGSISQICLRQRSQRHRSAETLLS